MILELLAGYAFICGAIYYRYKKDHIAYWGCLTIASVFLVNA